MGFGCEPDGIDIRRLGQRQGDRAGGDVEQPFARRDVGNMGGWDRGGDLHGGDVLRIGGSCAQQAVVDGARRGDGNALRFDDGGALGFDPGCLNGLDSGGFHNCDALAICGDRTVDHGGLDDGDALGFDDGCTLGFDRGCLDGLDRGGFHTCDALAIDGNGPVGYSGLGNGNTLGFDDGHALRLDGACLNTLDSGGFDGRDTFGTRDDRSVGLGGTDDIRGPSGHAVGDIFDVIGDPAIGTVETACRKIASGEADFICGRGSARCQVNRRAVGGGRRSPCLRSEADQSSKLRAARPKASMTGGQRPKPPLNEMP